MILWSLIAREVRYRPGRALLTLLSIVIGVAAVVSVTLAVNATRQSYREMYESVAGRAALEVVTPGGGSFDASLVETLERLPGVKSAVPSLQQFTVMYYQGNRFRLQALGIDPVRQQQTRDWTLKEGRPLTDGEGALLEAGVAQSTGTRIGDQVRLLTRRGVRSVTVVGLVAPRNAAGLCEGGTIFLPLSLAQRFYGKRNFVDTISLVLNDNADESAVSAEVTGVLPTGLTVRRPAARTRLARETLVNAEHGLGFGSALTLVLAAFIILNTFLMNVGERRRQLAILRAIGATRGQIVRMLLYESLAMGIAGTVLGSLVGLGGAHLLLGAIAQLFAASPPALQLTAAPFLLAAVLGPTVSVLAACIPARVASRISPLEGMRPPVHQDGADYPRVTVLCSLAVFVLAGLTLGACIAGWLPIGFSIPSGITFLASFVFIMPAVLDPVVHAVVFLLQPIFGTEGYLACLQTVRRSTRTTLTIGVLYIAVSTGIGLGTTIMNNVDDVRAWYRKTMAGDFFIRAMFPSVSSGLAVEMETSLADELRHLPGVRNVDTVRFLSSRVKEDPVVVVVREFSDTADLPLDLAGGNPAEVRRALFRGEVVVGTVLAQRIGVKPGDEISLETRLGVQPLRVAATAVEYSVGGFVVYMERSLAKQLFQVEGVDAFLIHAEPNALTDTERRLAAFVDQHGLMLHSFADLSRLLDAIMVGVVRSLWGVLILGFIVAAFGIANTLTMNVLEQTREIALLRVITMTRWQVRKMIFAQATIIGVIGLLTGTVAGVNTAYLISLCMWPLLGYPVTFAVSPALLIGSSAAAFLIVLVAAWLPAERAARLNLLIPIKHE